MARTPTQHPVAARIIAHARQHFFVHGFRNVTMDDIAVELGISKKTLYAHFRGKTDLLKAVIHAKLSDVESDMGRLASEGSMDFPTRLQRLLECHQRHLQEPQPAFVRDMEREPEIFNLIQTFRRSHIPRLFGRLFEDGRHAKLIRKDIPSALVLDILLGAIEAIINPRKLEGLELTPKMAFSMIVGVVLQGILTEKGRSQL